MKRLIIVTLVVTVSFCAAFSGFTFYQKVSQLQKDRAAAVERALSGN